MRTFWLLLSLSLLMGLAAADEGTINAADNAWVLISAALVLLMIPGVGLFYGGMVRKKNAISTIIFSFAVMSIISLQWILYGYTLAFGTDVSGLIGGLDFLGLNGVGMGLKEGLTIPSLTFMIFQAMFAIITVSLITGSYVERIKFSSFLVFSLAWATLVYDPVAHWVWGGGSLAQMGAMDFAGGLVVHITAGVSALAVALVIGARKGYGTDPMEPHNIPTTVMGAALLWFGWFGFNGGSTVSATGDKILVSMSTIFVTTNLAAAAASTATMILTWLRYGKPDVSMTLNGVLAGLVAITAGCDAVSPVGAFFIGTIAGIAVVFVIEFIDQVLKIDDPVGAIGVHGFCGALGTILTGVFALDGGLLYSGSIDMLITQLIGVVSVAAWVFVTIGIVFTLIHKTIGLRVSEAEEITGLDLEEHGLASSYADFMPTLERDSLVTKHDGTRMLPVETAIPVVHRPAETTVTADGHKLSLVSIVTAQERFEALKSALDQLGITGMTVAKVLGYGIQKGHSEMYRGAEVPTHLLPKVQVDVVVSKIPVRDVIETAKKVLYTGKYGDGKIFVYDVENAVKIRTGEEGYDALQDTEIEESK